MLAAAVPVVAHQPVHQLDVVAVVILAVAAKIKQKIAVGAVYHAIKPIPHHTVHCVEVVFIIGGTIQNL